MRPRRLRFAAHWLDLILNVQDVRALGGLPRFLSDWQMLRAAGGPPSPLLDSYPCLVGATSNTAFDAHYTYQAAWIARHLARTRPARHVDVGSSVQLIVAISAFVDTDFLDYRPVEMNLAGLTTGHGDLMDLPLEDGSVESLSCLHVIEHIGLGRYGDPIDPLGSDKAAAALARKLKPKGRLYISVPTGRARICFNAHRVFDPVRVPALFSSLSLIEFSYVDDSGAYHADKSPVDVGPQEYACGLYCFTR